MKQFENCKKAAYEDAVKIKEEDDILKEKGDTYNIVKNRVAYLRKKIEECNKYIDKQDNLIDKIKSNQQRIFETTEQKRIYQKNKNN